MNTRQTSVLAVPLVLLMILIYVLPSIAAEHPPLLAQRLDKNGICHIQPVTILSSSDAHTWWTPPWVQVIALLLLIALIAGAIRWQVYALQRRSRLLEAQVKERVKELNCLYTISRIAERPDISLEDFIRKTVEIIPPAYQYPNATCARINLTGQEFKTENYTECSWTQTAPILIHNEQRGVVEVGYLKESADNPFLPEEKDLINGIAEQIGKITARKQAEDALRESEERFRVLFNNVNEAVFVHPLLPDNQPGPFVQVNQAARAMLGYSPEELSHMTPGDLSDPESDQADIPAALQQLREKGSAVFKAPQVAKDGRKVLVEVNANVFELKGRTYVISAARDITERARMEAAAQTRLRIAEAAASQSSTRLLQMALDELEALTNSKISFYHFLLDDQETITLQTWSTNTLEHMCNAEGQGRHYPVSEAGVWVDCIHQKQPVIHNDYTALPHRKGLPEGHAPLTRELLFPIMRGKHIVAILGVGNKPTDYNQKDVEVVSLLANFSWEIIGRKRAEEQLKHYATELERSNEELESFAQIVSHDLQAPLHMVRSYLDLLQKRYRDQLGDRADKYIHFAVDGAERMSDLIKALLDYARVSTRGQAPTPTDAEHVLRHVLQTLQFKIRESGAEVIHEPLPSVLADETQLEQLFQNLVGNALKFHAADRALSIHISVAPSLHHHEGQDTQEWQFSITDNGIGIAPEQTDRLFKIFQRLHTREEYEGTGIGLATCKKIVERHNGRIWVESILGEGSTFYFTLPRSSS